jgi:hypothetical protein
MIQQIAYGLLQTIAATDADSADTQAKWRQLMDLALATSNMPLAEECALAAQDLSGLLLLYTSSGNVEGLRKLARSGAGEGRANIAFTALFSCGAVDECIQLLLDAGKVAEVRRMHALLRGWVAANGASVRLTCDVSHHRVLLCRGCRLSSSPARMRPPASRTLCRCGAWTSPRSASGLPTPWPTQPPRPIASPTGPWHYGRTACCTALHRRPCRPRLTRQ